MGSEFYEGDAKLECLREEVQKDMDDLEQGRYTVIRSDEDMDTLFAEVRRRAAERIHGHSESST